MSEREKLEASIVREAKILAEKYTTLNIAVVKVVLLRGYQMGFEDTRDAIMGSALVRQ